MPQNKLWLNSLSLKGENAISTTDIALPACACIGYNITCTGSSELFTTANTLRPVSWFLIVICEMLLLRNEKLAPLSYFIPSA